MIVAILPLLASCAAQVHPETMNALIKTESGYNPNAIALIKGQSDLDVTDKLKSAMIIGDAFKSPDINPSVSVTINNKAVSVTSVNQLLDLFDSNQEVSKISVSWQSKSIMPDSQEKAESTVILLEKLHANYSVGLGQVNRANFSKYQTDGKALLDPCTNLKVSQQILKQCFLSSPDGKVSEALSCYYAGNYTFGFKHDSGMASSYTQRIASNFVPENKIVVPSVGRELSYIKERNQQQVTAASSPQNSSKSSKEKSSKNKNPATAGVEKNGHIYDLKQGEREDVLAVADVSNKHIF
ncbi:TPA: transglycosylase SLT domain-containing protein [Yersinia enterocolitica]|nr:transglycosylase SLT domain-containing protein [Yersinia enterocolitica]